MRLKFLSLALVAALPLAAANTQITDTIRYLNGTLASCTFAIYGPVSTANVGIATTAGDGSSVTPSTYTYQVVAGVLSVSIHPNDDLTPSGTTYRVTRSCRPPGPQSAVEYWSVPTSATPLTVANVLVSTTSTSTLAYGQIRGLTLGDLLYGGSTGYATRLPRPADGTYSLTFTAGIPGYTAASASGLPSMTGESGKYLTNNGSAASWASVAAGAASAGLITAVQTSDGVGGFADSLCTAASGALVCAAGVSTSTLLGTSSFAWSLIAGPLAQGTDASRPACSSAGYYLASDTHALTRCNGAAWSSTLNQSGSIACIVDSTADAFQCYDSSGAALIVPATRTVAGHALSADVTVSKSDVGLGNADNTADANKPISTATQAALDAKAAAGASTTVNGQACALGSTCTVADATKVPTTRAVNGHALSADVTVSKSDVGLANADNTSDANKPVSTAAQAALDLKENLANKTTSTSLGTSDTLYPSQNAVKSYVDAHAGTGTVTTTGTMTTGALVTSSGTTVVKTPSATATLDASGNMVLPGTLAIGAPVPTVGPELISNPTFAGGSTPTDWTLGFCQSASSNSVTMAWSNSGPPWCGNLSTDVSLVSGTAYLLTFTISSMNGSAWLWPVLSNQNSQEFLGETWFATTPGTVSVAFVSSITGSDTLGLTVWNNNEGEGWTITNVSLHAIALPQPRLTISNYVGLKSFSVDDVYGNFSLGEGSLISNTGGYSNVAIGPNALYNNLFGYNNIALGGNALIGNTNGFTNVAVGLNTLNNNTVGNDNIAIGINSMYFNTEGLNNLAIGPFSLYGNTTGTGNTTLGYATSGNITTGTNNTAVGRLSCTSIVSGSNNICIGNQANPGSDVSNTTVIGNPSTTTTLIYGGGSAGKAMCWKTAQQLGYCSTVVGADGSCTCN